VVTVRDGVIDHVEPDAGRPRAGLPSIDLGELLVLPGFIDVHAHLTLPADGRPYETVHASSDEDLLETGRANALRHLRGGVTTVRDNGARGDLGTRLRGALGAQLVAPRVLVAGRPLTPPGGHFHFCGGSAATVADVREAVHRLAEEGVDHIKIIASGGGTTGSRPEESTYSLDHLRAAVTAAHARGLKVAAHCRGTESLGLALRAGVDCVEHADFLTRVPGAGAVVAYDEEIGAMLRDQGTWISMTLQAGGYDTLLELRDDPAADPDRLSRLRSYFADKLSILERLLHEGLEDQIVISTDAGPSDTRFGRFGLGLALADQVGWKPPAALHAVTSRAAKVAGLTARAGQIAAGLSADFVAVAPGFFNDGSTPAQVRWVMIRGVEVPMPEARLKLKPTSASIIAPRPERPD
jgi:imidazolonepropionase-like amidohydrolase